MQLFWRQSVSSRNTIIGISQYMIPIYHKCGRKLQMLAFWFTFHYTSRYSNFNFFCAFGIVQNGFF